MKFQKPKKFDYNLVIIGAGSAGLSSAYIAAALKAKVALVEKYKTGGDCLNTGCVPSKSILSVAKILSYQNKAKAFGLDNVSVKFSFNKIMKHVHGIIKKIEPHDSFERYKKLGVDCFQGEAKILSPYLLEVDNKLLTTKNIIIATGASPRIPEIKGIEKIKYFTSDTIWSLKKQPKNMVIIGGGPIGCEMAQAFSRLGSNVSILQHGNRILNREDKDVSELVEKTFEEENVKILKDIEIKEIKENKIVCKIKKKKQEIEFDALFISIGRKANKIGDLDIELNSRGGIKTDKYLRTNYKNIFACGDVLGGYQFTHTASYQAWYCVVNALFPIKFGINYRVVPWCTFVDPEVARVGINEQEAEKMGIKHVVTKYDLNDLDRAITENCNKGFLKVLTKEKSDKILGVTIVGSRAGELIHEFVLAMKCNLGLNKILSTIHVYPTFSEANKYVAGQWKKQTTSGFVFNILLFLSGGLRFVKVVKFLNKKSN